MKLSEDINNILKKLHRPGISRMIRWREEAEQLEHIASELAGVREAAIEAGAYFRYRELVQAINNLSPEAKEYSHASKDN